MCNLASIALPRYVKEKVPIVCLAACFSKDMWGLAVSYRFLSVQCIPSESQPTKLVGSLGSKDRYFDFDKLAEVCS